MNFDIRDHKLFIDENLFTINNIEFFEILGSGKNATTFSVYNNILNRNEVVKIWVPREEGSTVYDKQFLAEVRKNAKFHHNKIAVIYEADIQNEIYYCRMEYVAGVTLRSFIEKDPDFIFRYSILKDILLIMKDVYDQGLYHGDLHDRNIILEIDNIENLKIIDFGTSVKSGAKYSHNRDAIMLCKLCYRILPEIGKISFIKENLKKQPSSTIRELMSYALPIVFSIFFEDYEKFDRYTFIERFEVPLSVIESEFPFIQKSDIKKFLTNLKNR